jgi:hypothetical protein
MSVITQFYPAYTIQRKMFQIWDEMAKIDIHSTHINSFELFGFSGLNPPLQE